MFGDIGFWEITIIGVMALIVLGPERLPGAARTAGKWVGKARRMVADVKRDLKAELNESDIQGLKDIGDDIRQAGESLKGNMESVQRAASSPMDNAIADAINPTAEPTSSASDDAGKEGSSPKKPSADADEKA